MFATEPSTTVSSSVILSELIIIITFISGAKPIAENKHNMKRTKIKHTTHKLEPICC